MHRQMIMEYKAPIEYANHMYQATDLISGWSIQSRDFPEITKCVRKHVKLRHGNRLRTILLEKGVIYACGVDRKNTRDKNGDPIYWTFEITIQRW